MAINTTTDVLVRAVDGELSGDDYMALVNAKDTAARVAAAGREDAPLGALIAFTMDKKSEVRAAVAANPGIGRATTVASALADDKSIDVLSALIDNPAVGRSIIERIAADGPKAARSRASVRLNA